VISSSSRNLVISELSNKLFTVGKNQSSLTVSLAISEFSFVLNPVIFNLIEVSVVESSMQRNGGFGLQDTLAFKSSVVEGTFVADFTSLVSQSTVAGGSAMFELTFKDSAILVGDFTLSVSNTISGFSFINGTIFGLFLEKAFELDFSRAEDGLSLDGDLVGGDQ